MRMVDNGAVTVSGAYEGSMIYDFTTLRLDRLGHTSPFDLSLGVEYSKCVSGDEMALIIEQIVDLAPAA